MRIREFSNIRMGYAFRERLENVPSGDVAVIQPKNISRDGIVWFGAGEPLRSDVVAPKTLKAKDVLVVNRGRFGAAVFDDPDEGKWIVPSSIIILTMQTDEVLPEYVAVYLNSADGQKMFRQHSEQTTIPFISMNNLGSMEIPIPSLKRQQLLIALDHTVRKSARLCNRRQELHRKILNYELTNSVKRRTR